VSGVVYASTADDPNGMAPEKSTGGTCPRAAGAVGQSDPARVGNGIQRTRQMNGTDQIRRDAEDIS